MKKIFLTLTIITLLFSSCKKEADSPSAIRNQIMEYRQKITDINKKIDELNQQLVDDTNNINNNIKVEIQKAQKQPFEHYVEVSANVDAVENSMISPQLNGQITRIYVKEGKYVKKGQILIKLNDEIQRKNLAQLQTNLVLADTMYQKQKKLYDQNVISEVQYLQAKNQKESLEKNIEVLKSQIELATIRAPFTGIVDQIFVKEGELAMPGKPALQVVNLTQMEAVGEISEKFLPQVDIGEDVMLTFQTYPNIKIKGKISFKGNVIDPVNRTFRIKVLFSNIDNKIKPNMLAVIKLKDYESEGVFLVKTEILARDINGWYLFVINNTNNKNIVEKRYVHIGASDQTNTVVTDGIEEGDQIVVYGYNLIKNGMQVNIEN